MALPTPRAPTETPVECDKECVYYEVTSTLKAPAQQKTMPKELH